MNICSVVNEIKRICYPTLFSLVKTLEREVIRDWVTATLPLYIAYQS